MSPGRLGISYCAFLRKTVFGKLFESCGAISLKMQAPLLALSIIFCCQVSAVVSNKLNFRNAYVTMMYMGTPRDYEYYVAIRVMLLRLARLKANADLVLIASNDVPLQWIRPLQKEGVIVKSVDNIENPYRNQVDFDKRFTLTLNKIYAWSLVEYDRVVMLDADNLFVQNTDELFQCGQFCAVFINPCIFHTGLFVLEPSKRTFNHMMKEIAYKRENKDGADQGFLSSYFEGLLAYPLFYPPRNGSRLGGLYRLPLGYQMDASYFYVRLKWNVPCGPNSVITFPGAPWLKPWYWWSWPLLPLGLSWHEHRTQTIGYGAEIPLVIVESLVYLIIVALSTIARKGFSLSSSKVCSWKQEQPFSFYCISLKLLILCSMLACYLVPFYIVPRTIHPLVGWGLYFLGSLSFGMVLINVLQLPALPVLTPWLAILGTLMVLVFPFYSNGIVRAVSLLGYAFLVSPCIWRALCRIMSRTELHCRFNKIC